MRTIKTTLVVLAALAVGAIAYAYSGIYDVSARSQHSGLVNWLLSTASHASVERRSMSVNVPDLDEESMVLAGINDFDAMCVGCHGAPGVSPEAMGQGLNPPAPDLAKEAAEMSPAELFWVTKNGIRMTGMPAWGVTHDDDAIWPVVAIMMQLPELDAAGYQELLASAAGHGHHADDGVVDEHSHAGEEETSGGSVHLHNDGTEHVHEDAAEDEESEHEHD